MQATVKIQNATITQLVGNILQQNTTELQPVNI